MSLPCTFRNFGMKMAHVGLVRPAGPPLLLSRSLNSHSAIRLQPLKITAALGNTNMIRLQPLNTTALLGNTNNIRLDTFRRTFYSPRAFWKTNGGETKVDDKSKKSEKIKDVINYPVYDMPMKRFLRKIRIFFVINTILAVALAVWVAQSIYSVLIAGMIGICGFAPMAAFQLFFRTHVKTIRMLGTLSKKQVRMMRNPAKLGNKQMTYPVMKDTPLAVQRFTFFATDPVTRLRAQDLQPGPIGRFSVMWIYKPPKGRIQKFRISLRILQNHTDIRLMDRLIRTNERWKNTDKTGKNRNYHDLY